MNDKNTCHLINQMSNIIPPLVSSSPPPMVPGETDDLDEDEFGDFTAAADLSSFEGYSLPTTPQHSSLSNYLTSISTQNTFPTTQTNFIISPTLTKSCETDDHIQLTNQTEYKSSENIFCDIKTDVNVHKNETSFVNNKTIDNDNQEDDVDDDDVENIVSSVQNTEQIKSKNEDDADVTINDTEVEMNEDHDDHCDKQKNECFKNNSEFNNKSEIIENDAIINVENSELLTNLEKNTETQNNCTCVENSDSISENSEVLKEENTAAVFNDCAISVDETKYYKEESENFDDDFTAFKSPEIEIDDKVVADITTPEIIVNNTDDFDDFTDFKAANESSEQIQQEIKADDDDDFDDFGDFNDYSIVEEEKSNEIEFVANFEQPDVKNADELFKNIFTFEETKLPDCKTIDFINNDVFKLVQDIENTNALSYHWTNSESQKTMLKALNIDSRNILFGPRWNVSMPRFAANLGFTPLEPMKSDISSAASPSVPPQNEQQTTCEVPDAKFDWNSSGLVNPLDSQAEPVKTETIEDKLNINQQSNNLNLDGINTPLDIKSDSESVNSLKFIESAPDTEIESKNEADTIQIVQSNEIPTENTDEDDFTSFQSSKQLTNWTPNLVPVKLPLRETHISTNNVEHNPIYSLESFELESTVVTPDLPRKAIEITETVEEDDFNDFQMGTPQTENPTAPTVASIEPLKPLEPLKPIVLETQAVHLSTQINWPEPGVVSDDLQEFDFNFKSVKTDTLQPENIEKETSSTTVETLTTRPIVPTVPTEKKPTKLQTSASEEDDWSDFVCVQNSTQSPKMNLPKAMIPQNSFSNLFTSSQLELSVPNLQNTQLSKTSVLPPTFMPNSSPIKTNSQPSTQQIAAQQIGLGYQPPYQISLQTISTPFGGLPQTSLASYNHFSIGPTELTPQNLPQQTKPKTSGGGLFDGPFHPELKPFQCLQNNTESHYVNPTGYQLNSVESTFLKMQQTPEKTKESLNTISAQAQDDDDDWTDFVSSQPVPSMNGFSKQNVNNFTPNIIANPVHFEAFQSYQQPTPSGGPSLHKQQLKNKNSIPSISALPDLDFIAPKTKFFSKK